MTVSLAEVCGVYSGQINRTVHLCKTRNGRGHGLCLGYMFHGESLQFEELGVIQVEEKN